jgi:hypothetical protein
MPELSVGRAGAFVSGTDRDERLRLPSQAATGVIGKCPLQADDPKMTRFICERIPVRYVAALLDV